MCVTNDNIYFRLSFRRTWVFSCLSGARVVHVVHIANLYDVISCNVRYHVRATFEFSQCRGFIFLLMLFVLCYVYWHPTRSHDVRVSVLLSPCLYWCWLVHVTSYLEFVPSVWSKHFNLLTKTTTGGVGSCK